MASAMEMDSPPALQEYVVYGAAVAADSSSSEKAVEFVKFLSDPGVRGSWRAAGFESPNGTE
jgi:ABC-type molybdate transport system substrate-binding protein